MKSKSTPVLTGANNPQTTPDPFTFPNKQNAAPSTTTTSDIIQITGIQAPIDVAINGNGGPEYRICTDGPSPAACDASVVQNWTSNPKPEILNNNNFVQIRLLSNPTPGSSNSATIVIGGVSKIWQTTSVIPDTTPNAFAFSDVTNQAISSTINSDIIQISGINAGADISITGGNYRICSDAACTSVLQTWGSIAGTGAVANNNYVQVQLTSSGSYSTLASATLTIGGVSDQWDVTTGAAPDTTPNAFAFSDVTNQAISSTINSDIIQISGINAGADISITGGNYRICSDAACTSVLQTWGSIAGTGAVANNNYVQVQLTSSGSYSTLASATLTIGGVSDQWDVTTGAAPDTTPNAFAFSDVTNQAISSTINSDIIQISGINAGADISITGGNYRICSDAACTSVLQTWGSVAGTGAVANNNYVQVQLTSSGSYSTLASATLTIGGVSDQWDVTTGAAPDTTPNAFAFSDVTNQAISTLINSDIIQISGINAGADISITGGNYRICSDAACTSVLQTWGSVAGTGAVANNNYVQVQLTSSGSYSTLASATLTIGGVSDQWDVTTGAAGDTVPDAFSFTDLSDLATSSIPNSNIIQISGINAAADISITSGEFRVCTDGSSSANCDGSEIQTWTSVSQMTLVNNGNWVQIRVTSPATNLTQLSTTLTIGTVSDVWTVSTISASGNSLYLSLDATNATSYSGSGQTWNDLSGNNFNFILGSDGTSDATDPNFNGTPGGGSGNEYFEYNGSNYFSYGAAQEWWMQNLHKNNAKYTIEIWFRTSALMTTASTLFSNVGSTSGGTGVWLKILSNNKVQFRTYSGGSIAAQLNSSGKLTPNTLYRIALAVDEANSDVRMYINKVETSSTLTFTSPATGSASGTTLNIGAQGSGNASLERGTKIYSLKIYGDALTSTALDTSYDTASPNLSNYTETYIASCSNPSTGIYICGDEYDYVMKLAELGYSSFTENFDTAAWSGVRNPLTVASLTNNGVSWSSHCLEDITIHNSNSISGYELHSSGHCGLQNSGVQGSYSGTLTAVGFWLDSNSGNYGSDDIVITLDGSNTYALPNDTTGSFAYVGIIDTTGFSNFDIYEPDTDTSVWFFDSFTFGH